VSQPALTVVETSQLMLDLAPLPDGWQWKRLGDLCDFIRGVSFDKGDVKMLPTSGHIPILRAGNIGKKLDTTNDLIWLPSQNVSQEQRFQEKDIAVCMSSGSPSVVGKTAQLEEPFEGSVGAFCGIIRARSVGYADYLSYWLRSPNYEGWRDGQTRGANIQNLRFSEFASILLPLPPPAELNRIAAILKEQMIAVERARVAAEAQLKAAKDLPDAYLREVFESPDAKRWEKKQLKDLCDRITDGTHQPPPFVSSGVPFLFVRNIVSGRIDFNVSKYVSLTTYEELTRRCKPVRNDVLYSAVGSFGVAVVVDTDEPFTFQRHIAHLKPKRDLINSRFLALYLNSSEGKAQSEAVALGGAQRTVTLSSLAKFEVPLPLLTEQKQIAEQLAQQIEAGRKANKILQDQLEAINKLPAALLRQAFTGKL
jgi:type I restriction enzyme, S subunit